MVSPAVSDLSGGESDSDDDTEDDSSSDDDSDSDSESDTDSDTCSDSDDSDQDKDTKESIAEGKAVPAIENSSLGMGKLAFEKFQKQDFEDLAYFEPFYLKDFIAIKPRKDKYFKQK